MERQRKQQTFQDKGKTLWGEDGEETNSKEKQDEGEPGRGKVIFHFFFILVLQFTAIR